jgi:hypothetical protein
MHRDEPIRWLAATALALASACGEDGGAAPLDASQNEAAATSAPDTREEERDAGEEERDAGSSADASLELGDERIAQAALDFCRVSFACDPQMSAMYLESEDDCPAIVEGFVRDGVERDGVACGSAQLDAYECYASVGCDEQFTACEQQADQEVEACPFSLGEAQ